MDMQVPWETPGATFICALAQMCLNLGPLDVSMGLLGVGLDYGQCGCENASQYCCHMEHYMGV